MILYVNVKLYSREDKIEKHSDNEYAVWVREPADKGKANKAAVKLLSKEFGVSYKNIEIKNSIFRRKIVEIKNKNQVIAAFSD